MPKVDKNRVLTKDERVVECVSSSCRAVDRIKVAENKDYSQDGIVE